jgi:uncharacterized membrane protein
MHPSFALGVAFLWATLSTVHKLLLSQLSHPTVLLLTSIVYTVMAFGYTLGTQMDKLKVDFANHLTLKNVSILVVSTITAGFLANVLYYRLMESYDSHLVTALVYSSPVFATILAWLVLKEKIAVQTVIGIVITFIGLAVILNTQTVDKQIPQNTGYLKSA